MLGVDRFKQRNEECTNVALLFLLAAVKTLSIIVGVRMDKLLLTASAMQAADLNMYAHRVRLGGDENCLRLCR